MLTRRKLIVGLGAPLLLSGIAGASQAAFSASADADELIALPGKRPLAKRTFRPPNFETPLAALRTPFTANELFFVRYHLSVIPEVDARTWRLKIGGASAKREIEFSLDDLKRRFERVSVVAINQCSGNRRGLFQPRVPGIQWNYGAMGNAQWGGVRLRDVLQVAGVRGDAIEVVCDGADSAPLPGTPDFIKSLPMQRALDEHTLIAFEMNGEPLPHWNGAPARLVVPGWTATYWTKHLTSLRMEPKPFDGFWMKSAYRVPTGLFPGYRFASQEHDQTTPITEILVNSLVTSHTSGQQLQRGQPAVLKGWAWDEGSGIAATEVSVDAGRSWRNATLGNDLGRFGWRGFELPLDTSSAGELQIAVRAISRSGARQPDKLVANPSGYHHNIVQTLTLGVA